ncbi:hypothetical protein PVAND_005959 [Polypedilum vanderplanki]|uniref:Spliceosome-associated protein CWC27 homolog n=1 Tax=Polypedilum vanderplanki TaxID=319348 RepID=A0A9J6C1N8_POLVA|nr:hypothetical protein PVAND_005959 [Polypedilum vanderplanki]
MSNIYIQEPPTNGKILLKTTVGEIEIELWSKEAPKTCRNFVQLCLDGFYNGTIFHRLVKNFIVQGGENSELADLIEPIKNEFHSRLRFCRRGLVAMATNEGSDNNMQFFFTLDQTPELQNTHTIFGKVTGDTVYNMIKLNESQTDANERVLYPHKINKVKILNNPFSDIKQRYDRQKSSKEQEVNESKKKKKEGVKNFKLISFGDEAEQDEMEVESEKFPKKLDQPITSSSSSKKDKKKDKGSKRSRSRSRDRRDFTPPLSTASKSSKDDKDKNESKEDKHKDKKMHVVDEDSDSDIDLEESMRKEKMAELEKRRKEIQEQIKDVKRQYQKDKKDKAKEAKEDSSSKIDNEVLKDYLDEKEKYKKSKVSNIKGASRENFTLSLLAKFKNKLQSASTSERKSEDVDKSDDDEDDGWLAHKLDFSESQEAVLAKDASKKSDDWYSIYDPRNPLNKRKRDTKKTPATQK